MENVPIEIKGTNEINEEEVIEYFTEGIVPDDFLREPWLRSFAISVLEKRKEAVKGTASERKYFTKIEEVAWERFVEDDPILIFWRARACETGTKYSRSVSYLKEVIKMCPQLIRARTKLIEVCHEMLKKENKVPSELVFIRDTAEELLERYDRILFVDEKEKLKEILDSANAG